MKITKTLEINVSDDKSHCCKCPHADGDRCKLFECGLIYQFDFYTLDNNLRCKECLIFFGF
jgi:hypothetical protein